MRITKERKDRAWPQQPIARAAVLAYRHQYNLDPPEFAVLLEVSASHLHNLLYDYRTRPSLDVIERLSGILGMDAGELMDNRGGNIPGMGDPVPELSPAKRLVAKLMIYEIGSDEVTDEQALRYLDALRALKSTVRK